MALNMEPEMLARQIESTLLRPDATHTDVERLCADARKYGFAGVCVQGSRVIEAVHLLDDSEVKVVTVVGFPLGGVDRDVKRYETEVAIDNGASEIDAVMNIGWFKEGKDKAVFQELRDIVEAADERMVKIVIETALLTRAEIGRACKLAIDAGAHFVKTSTGYAGRGVTVEDIQLIRAAIGPELGIKAAGGIRDNATALALIEAGANRLGTSSAIAVLHGAV
jgi:deoxyribose-phosphate aldolase